MCTDYNTATKNKEYKGGFDVVIGNPPYVKARDNDDIIGRKFIENNYESPYKMWDLYVPFIEKGINLTKANGVSSMIIPDTIGKSEYTSKLIDYIELNYYLYQIDFFPKIYVFENVGVRSKITFIQKKKSKKSALKIVHTPTIFDVKYVETKQYKGIKQYLLNIADFEINNQNCITLGDICYVSYGMRLNSDKLDPNKFKKSDLLSIVSDEIHSKLYTEGKYLDRYLIKFSQYLEYDTERCPARLVRPTFPELYPPNKILLSRQKKISAISYDKHYCDNTIIMAIPAYELKNVNNNSIKKYYKNIGKNRLTVEENSTLFDLHYLLALINSKLMSYHIRYESKEKIDFYPDDWKNLPIKENNKLNQKLFILKVKEIQTNIFNLTSIFKRFIDYLLTYHKEILISRKLQNWHKLDFSDFIKELNKAIKKVSGKKLTKTDEMEWMEVFETKKAEAQTLQAEIDKIDAQIDTMVYELYGLSEEEIKIVENS